MPASVALKKANYDDDATWAVLYGSLPDGESVYISPHNRYCFADDGYYYIRCAMTLESYECSHEFDEGAVEYTYAYLGTLDKECKKSHTIGKVRLPGTPYTDGVCIDNPELYDQW